ncbi:MAG: RluA family pseudouridine synthase [Firmicutes bacterium]|nr:RluA family pseudouridine synthase [Bacillota bacterium]
MSRAEKKLEVTVVPEAANQRLDKYLAQLPEVPSRSYAEKAISEGLITVNGEQVKRSYKVCAGDRISVVLPPPKEISLEPEPIPLKVLYEDADLIIVDKPRGMVVHPAAGHESRTLVNALLYHADDLSGIGGELRPGIVHRLDKDTTGLLVAAKNDFTHLALSKALKAREIHRWYLALVHGRPKAEEGSIEAPVGRHPVNRKKMAVTAGGRPAFTRYRVLETYGEYSLLQLKLKTGRTHQIRVHLAYIGLPVVADPVYGKGGELGLAGQALHAFRLRLIHPRSGELLDYYTPPPADFQRALGDIGGLSPDYAQLAVDNWGLD